MNSQMPDKQQSDKQSGKKHHKTQTANDLLNDAIFTLESIVNATNYQILGNIDEAIENLTEGRSAKEKDEIKVLVENFIKRPFRRQVGRLKTVKRLIIEAQQKE